jgi:hypothetical protein
MHSTAVTGPIDRAEKNSGCSRTDQERHMLLPATVGQSVAVDLPRAGTRAGMKMCIYAYTLQ